MTLTSNMWPPGCLNTLAARVMCSTASLKNTICVAWTKENPQHLLQSQSRMNQYNLVAEIGMTSKLCVQMSMIAQKKYQQIEQINLISLY